MELILAEGSLGDPVRADPTRREEVQHPRQRDLIRSRLQPAREREPLGQQIIPISSGRNRLNKSECGAQQGSDVVPPAAGYVDGRRRDFLNPVREEPSIRGDLLRRSPERAGDGAHRRCELLPFAFRQVDGLEGRKQIRKSHS